MTDNNSTAIHERTTEALAALIRQQQHVATFCACGALGTVRDGNHTPLLCARCWVVRYDALRPMPEDAITACEAYLARAQGQLSEARTLAEHIDARAWVANAARNLARWRAMGERMVQG